MDGQAFVNGVDGIANGGGDASATAPPSATATTITTVAVQAGKAKIVLAILKSHDWIRVRIQQMEPDLMEVGATLEEAKALRREHDELLTKLNMKQKDVTELLTRADDLAVQNKSYQEVYAAMAQSLSEAWMDLNRQLEYRKTLLDQSINFHESALQFSHKMEVAQDKFSNVGLAHDVDTARHLLQQHQDMKKNILESSMSTLQEGQLLLERIREMGVHADVQNRHATTAACYGIEHLLELLQDRRRHLEELWLQRRIRLEQCLQLLLLDQEVSKVSDWFEQVGDVYLAKKDLGSSLAMANALRDEHVHFERQAREIQDTVLRLIRTADQLVHGDRADAEAVRKRLQLVDGKCEDFTMRLDARRKNLAMARNFFTLTQTALTKLDEIEVQLASTGLPENSAALAERHAFLSAAIIETSAPALREGSALLERVGRDEPGAQGVSSMLTELMERCAKLESQCKARYEASERSQTYNRFTDKFNSLSSWLMQIGLATVNQNGDMGANLSTARDFLELHERLRDDMKLKKSDVNALSTTVDELAKSGDQEAKAAGERFKSFREQWDSLETWILSRIRLAQTYVAFHKRAQQLAIQMDVLEEYLKIEKLDPMQVPDSAVKHKEESFAKMSNEFTAVESCGKQFIKEATDTKVDEKLDTRRAIVVVETILSHFSERRYLITDYYEHWKVHVVSGKEFKTQWHQFIQDARKCIDWMVQEEKNLFAPFNAGYLGANIDEAKKMLDKLVKFAPTAKKAQDDVEGLLRQADLLSLKGDTKGQRDQIVTELLRVHTRLQARVNEYHILINMAIKFFENLGKVDKLIEDAEKEYSRTEIPLEPTKAEMMLREHEASRSKIKSLLEYTAEEGEEIVVRVRQQDAEAIAKDEVQRVLEMTEARRRQWEKTWENQKARLEQNLQMCQFFFDLRQLHGELDELHRQLNSRRGAYGNSLSTVKLTAQAFRQFEKSVDLIDGKVNNFSNTADTMIRDGRGDTRRLRREVDDVKRKWAEFHNCIAEYKQALDDSTKFFEKMDNCEGWINEASQFLLTIGRRATECKKSQDAVDLINQLSKFKEEGALQQNDRLNDMERVATGLYGQVSGPQKMQHIVDRNQDVLGNFVKAIEELAILRDNLLKKEQILAQMEAVVDKKAPKQPRFVQPLQNAEITEGQRFTFECRLECDTKTPKIDWLKEDREITSPDYNKTYKDGLCRLTIEETFSEDTARYTCRVTTDAGTTETSATLRVKETHKKVIPPEFGKQLRPVDAPEGTSIMLECQVSGVPVPTVSWQKNGEPIDSSPDYVITQINGTCCLKIRRAVREHTGQYTCSATNPAGTTTTTANVNVISVRKPQFIEPLKDTAVPEGQGVVLKCTFTAEPPPQIQWLKNDKQILPSAVFKITVEADFTSLEIREVFPEDAGNYVVIAKNLGGESRTSGRLTIQGAVINGDIQASSYAPVASEKIAPIFIQPLQNKEVQEGSRAHLMCVFSAQPRPEISWFHNDKPVRESKDFELTVDGDRCSLIIHEVYLEDSGEYKCVVKNINGTAQTTCRLMVEPLSELSDNGGSTPIPGDVVPPKFTQLLKDIECGEGEMVRFDCRVIGHPTPVIKWYRGRNQIQPSSDFQISCERELHSLTVSEVFKEDAGNYMVKASNAAGTAKCFASLSVKAGSEKHMVKTRLVESSHSTLRTVRTGHQPPEFTRLFRDMRVRPGEPCTMEVVIAGNPPPTVRWLFNNEPIISPHFRISSRPDGTNLLHIPEVFTEDAGRFSVLAENDAGKATCSALLVVVDESQTLPGEGSPPETPLTRVAPLGFGPPPVVPFQKPPQRQQPPPPRQQPPPPRQQPPPVPRTAPSPSFREEILIPEKTAPVSYQPVDVTIELPVPPEFVDPLRDIAAQEGTRVTFAGCVRGRPEPTIRWFREGRPLTGGADFEISYRDGRVSLSIPEVFSEDAGKYTCSAENKAGRTQSTAELVVKASMIPPQFADRLQTKEVKEGEAVRFTIRVTGKPAPDVTWFREGSKIVSSADFEILQDGDLHTLYIPEVFYEDSGKYTVTAANKAGQAHCTAELIVEAPSAVEESLSPSPPISRSPSITAKAVPFSGSSREASPRRLIPLFTKQLTNLTARQGDRVTLECAVAPFPQPEKVQWFRNEIEIFSTPDYTISFTVGGSCSLVIAEVFPEDSGTYKCTVTVNGVLNSTSMQLFVEAAPPPPRPAPSPVMAPSPRPVAPSPRPVAASPRPVAPSPRPIASPRPPPEHSPVFQKQLTNQCLQHGGTAYFECKVDGYPPPEILWTRRGHPLVDKMRYKSTYDQYSGVTTLTIYNLRDEDEGEYMCKAINALGESTTSATLLSQARFRDWEQGKTEAPKFYQPPQQPVYDGRASDYDMTPDDGFKVSHFEKRLNKEIDFRESKVPPKHDKEPFDESVGQGASVVDQTSYVAPETLRRMMKSPGDRRSRDRDLGGVSETFFRPVFRKVPVDIEVAEGQMARFDCVVTGRPNPDMFWYRDGVEVFDDRLHKIVINEDGINSLIFDSTSRSDSGQYTCIARNRGGEDRFQVRLNVLPRAVATAPRFTDRLANQTVLEGQPVNFTAEAVGVPQPMMSWQKDGRMLSSDDRYQIQTDGGRSSLNIAAARPDDSAWFQCTAASVAGTAINRAKLIVQVETRRMTPERKLSIPKRVITPTKEMGAPFHPRPASEPMPERMRVITPVSLQRPVETPPVGSEPQHRSRADILLSPTPPPKAPTASPQLWQPTAAAPPAPRSRSAIEMSPQPVPASPAPLVEAVARVPAPAPMTPISPVVATMDSRARPMAQKPFAPKQSELLKFIQDEEKADRPAPRPRDFVDSGRVPSEQAVPPYVKTTELPTEDMFHKERPRPPKFKTQMKPLNNLMENDPAHFECRLVPIGDPDMNVEWYRNGVLLMHGHRFRPTYDFGFVALDILYTYPEDNGTYVVKATNKYGSDTNEVQLTCYGKESVIYTSQLPEGIDSVQHIQDMEDACYRMPDRYQDEAPEQKAPVFDLLPEAVQVEEGETAKFMVKLSGHPRPKVKWWLNGTSVVNSQRFRLRYDGMIHILEIPKVRDYDSGVIRIVARNPLGDAECSSTLTVMPRDDWRSRLKQAPRSTVEVELAQKKNVELRSFELDQALKKPKTTVVELRAFERSAQEKASSYRDEEVQKACTDINLRHAQMARSDASRELRMHEPNVHIESEVHVARAKAMLNMPDDSRREADQRAFGKTLPTRKEPPTFTKPLQNIQAVEGQAIKMEVNYTGFPTPEIHWYREGVEIQPSRDFQITHLYQKSFLVVPEVFLEDSGTFLVRAVSPIGMAECRALLVVEEDTTRVREAPPEFRAQMNDITINIGEPVTFDCEVTGYPKPEVFWTKNGKRIHESPRWKLIVEENHYTLLIYEVHPEDAGRYDCVVTNKLGKASSSAQLNVSGQPAQVKPPSPVTTHAAPRLLEPMSDQQVREGEPVQFQCRISGVPDPVVQWYHNNQVIKPSKYFQLTAEPSTGYYGLLIAGVFPEDDGTYRCVARNPAGEVTCISQLRVIPISMDSALELSQPMEPPRFIKPINGLDVTEGGQAVFEAVLSGQPLPEVVWYHEGRPIQHGPDFQISRDGNKFTLAIREVLIEDSGIFTCRAANPAGVAECSAELFVEDVTRVSNAQMQMQRPGQERKAPRFVQPPAPVHEVQVGSTAKLEVQLDANPPPQITWTTGGRTIHPSARHDVRYDNGVVVLLIMNVQPQDAGEYQLRASNELGEVTCKTVLNIKPKEKTVELPMQSTTSMTKHVVSQDMVPVFIVPLKPETRVSERSITRLECQVRAYPLPSITWHVNGVELAPSPKFSQTVVGEQIVLEIRDVIREDAGIYTCKARSAIGEATTSTALIVSVPEQQLVPPAFTKNLDNIVATDGREVTMSCVVTGTPMPEVSWFHNHKNIDNSEDFVITYDRNTGHVDLVIVDCLPDDQGRFRCIAKNAAGQAVSECTLTVKPAVKSTAVVPAQALPKEVTHTIHMEDVQRDTLEVEEQKVITDREVTTVVQKVVKRTSGQPPRFTQPIQPCVVREGDSCTFTAIVSGAPVPEICWLKDKVDLVLTSRHKTTFNPDTGECTLTIINAEPSDVGVYSCRATNVAGRATCTANVVVVPPDAEVTITEKTVSVKKEKVTMVGELETRVVESSPTFSETLMPITEVMEGDTVRFQCHITAEPEPTLTWYFNGREMTSTPRIQLTFDKMLTTLTITSATLDDTGEYICKATNALGEASTKTFLRVRPATKEPVRPVIAPQPSGMQPHDITVQFQQLPGEGPMSSDLPPGPLSAACSLIPLAEDEPPRFTLPLRNQTVNDGDRAVLRVFFSGYPTPHVTWYFNSQPVRPGQDFQINVDVKRCESTLVIVEVFPEDEGEYMCKAENPLGTAITHCHLFVRIPSSSEDESVEKLVSKTVEVVKTEQPISIRETRRFSETIAIDHKQRLQEMALQFKLPQPQKEKSELIVRRESLPKGMKMEIRLSPPKVVSERKMIELKQRAEAVATQRQELMIPLMQHRRFSETVAIDHRARPQEMTVQFQIPKPKLEKSQLVVHQKAIPKGIKMEVEVPKPATKELSHYEVRTTKRVEAIETQRQEYRMQVEGSPPVFVWELQSQKVMDGDETRFVAKVRGNPMPDVVWYHDSKVVYDNPDFRTSYNKETGEVVLFIVEVFPQDTGVYECVATNKYGSATTHARLAVEVYEYVPDSEEATASQTESIVSTSSMDETDFQAKTKRFLENMEKLRKEIHEENVVNKYAEELIEEAGIEVHGYEETILMADVKWQIPKRIAPELENIPIEKTEDSSVRPTMEQPYRTEIIRDVGKAMVTGLRPSRVLMQTSRQLEEVTGDYYMAGVERSEQHEISVQLMKPQAAGQPETLVQPLTEKMAEEAAQELTLPAETTDQHVFIIDLLRPVIETRETRVQTVEEKTSVEAAEDMSATTASESTQQHDYEIELLESTIEGKKETLVESVMEKMAVEAADDLISTSETESTKQQEYVVELVQPSVEKKETHTLTLAEKLAIEAAEDIVDSTIRQSTQHVEYTVDLAQPSVEQKTEMYVQTVMEKTALEAAEDIAATTASESTQQEDYRVDLVESSVAPKKETQVIHVVEKMPEEATEEFTIVAPGESMKQQEISVELIEPFVETKREMLVNVVVEKMPEEKAEDLFASAVSELTKEEEYIIEIGVSSAGTREQMHVETVVESLPEEITTEGLHVVGDQPKGEEVVVLLDKHETETKAETRVVEVLEKQTEEVAQVIEASTARESTQQEEYSIELVTSGIEEMKETLAAPIEEKPAVFEAIVEMKAGPDEEKTKEVEIPVELVEPLLEEIAPTLVAPVEEKPSVEDTEEMMAQTSEITHEEQITTEFVQTSIQQKQEVMTSQMEEKAAIESTEEMIIQAKEDTQKEEYHIELLQPTIEEKLETRVVPQEEKPTSEKTEEFVSEISMHTEVQEISIDVGIVEKSETEIMLAPQEEKPTFESVLEVVQETTTHISEQEILIDVSKLQEAPQEVMQAISHEEQEQPTFESVLEIVPETTTHIVEQEILIDVSKQAEAPQEVMQTAPVEEQPTFESVLEIVPETTTHIEEQEILIDVSKQAEAPQEVMQTAPVEEQPTFESVLEIVPETTTHIVEQEILIDVSKQAEAPQEVMQTAPVEEQPTFESVLEIVEETTTHIEEQEILIDVSKQAEAPQEVMQTAPVVEKSTFEAVLQMGPETVERTYEAQVIVELSVQKRIDEELTHVESFEEKQSVEATEEISVDTTAQTELAEVVVPLSEMGVESKDISHAAPVTERESVELTDEIMTEISDTTIEQQVFVEFAQPAVEDTVMNQVTTVEEKAAEESIEVIQTEEVAQTQQDQIFVQLEQSEVNGKYISQAAPVEEKAVLEGIEDIHAETVEQTEEHQIVVQLEQSEVNGKYISQAAPVEEKAALEGIEDIHAETVEQTQEHQIVVQLEQSEVNGKYISQAAPVEEKAALEGIEEIHAEVVAQSHEDQIFLQLEQPEVNGKYISLAAPVEEQLSEEQTGVIESEKSDTSTEQHILVEYSKSLTEASRPARASIQVSHLQEETTEGEIQEVTVEITPAEEIVVHLVQSVKEAPLSCLTSTLEAKQSEERAEELLDQGPTPTMTESTEIQTCLTQHDIAAMEETRADAFSEVLSVSSLEENIESMKEAFMEGEEIKYELTETTFKTNEPTLVGVAEDHQSEEEEEEIFHDVTEPSIPGEEVVIELAAADVIRRPQTRVALLEGKAEIESIEVGPEEFVKEHTKEEEIQPSLLAAKKEAPKFSLVKMQETVNEPLKADDLVTEDIKKEITKESMTLVDLNQAASELPKPSLVSIQEQVLNMQRVMGMGEYHEEWTSPALIASELRAPASDGKPLTLVRPIEERAAPESVAEEYVNTIKEVYMIPSEVQPMYEPAVVERYRFETRIHGVERHETSASSTLAHVQQFSVASTTETTETLAGRTDVEWHIMREDGVIEEATAKEITHEDLEIVQRLGAEFSRADESFVSALSLMAPVFELPMSDVTVVEGERAVLECRVTVTPGVEITWYVDNIEIRRSEEVTMTYTEDGWCRLVIKDVMLEDEGEYTVKAVNEAGTCVSTAYLTILPASESEPSSPKTAKEMVEQETLLRLEKREEHHRHIVETTRRETTEHEEVLRVRGKELAPQFTTKLEAREVLEHHEVVLECHVIGFPEPEITWYQDGKLITSSTHIRIEYSEGTCRLTIDSITVDDEAEYMCEARNEHGVANTWAELLVESKRRWHRHTGPVVDWHSGDVVRLPCSAAAAA